MTAHEMHPEALIDGARRGELSPGEKGVLDRHLAECEVCRFEMALREDLSELEAPTDDPLLEAAVRAATATKVSSDGAPGSGRSEQSVAQRGPAAPLRPAARSRRRVLWLAAALLGVGLAGAAYRALSADDHSADPSPLPVVVAPPTTPSDSGEAVDAGSAQPDDLAPAPTPSEADHAPEARQPVRTPTASEFFSQALAARRRGDVPSAISTLRQLQARYPASSESQVSRVTLGRMLLDERGDAAGALTQFELYLASGGDLRAEALAGQAQALGALGALDREKATWEKLLREYPSSLVAEQARRRLSRLK